MKILPILRRTAFVLVLLLIITAASGILERKTVTGAWNYSVKVGGFKNEPENSFDILAFGSSHMYCTLSPLSLYEQTGLRSYVLATQCQPVIATYYYIKEALRTQSPDIIIVEAMMFALDSNIVDEGVAHDAIDPFPASLNKLRMIHEMKLNGSKESYYFPIIKYHSRWDELTAADFDFSYRQSTDPYHGYVFLTDAKENHCTAVSYEDVEERPIDEYNSDVISRIKALAEEHNAELLLLVAPYLMEETMYGSYRALHRFARENDITVLDMCTDFDSVGINNTTDFYDSGHLNVFGAQKATAYIGEYVTVNYDIVRKTADDDAMWKADLQIYHNNIDRAINQKDT